MKRKLQIAIDGPVAAGKSTVARLLAERLGVLYVDTGSMYRALALAARERGIDWNDEQGVCKLVSTLSIELARPVGAEIDGRSVTVRVGGKDVSWEIRTQEIGEGASVVSQYSEVRQILGRQQQRMAQAQSVVMEGRDIGTRVLPEAQLKIFMTAKVGSRVVWKQKQLKAQGQDLTLAAVREALLKRDEREMNREIDPLRPTEGAWILDTTDLSIDEVVQLIVDRVLAFT